VGKDTPLVDAFRVADDVLRQGIQGIIDLIGKPALINLDFADVKKVMTLRGVAHMGIGIGYGENKTLEAAKQAINSPLLDTTIEGARGIIFNVTGDPSLGMYEIQEAAKIIQEGADPDADVFFGVCIDPSLDDEVRITVIATGFDAPANTGAPTTVQKQKVDEKLKFDSGISLELEQSVPRRDRTSDELSELKTTGDKQMGDLEPFGDEDLEIPSFLKKKPRRNRTDY
ncbi:MAG: cell division protein FtsZ, partial [Christensenella sp.]